MTVTERRARAEDAVARIGNAGVAGRGERVARRPVQVLERTLWALDLLADAPDGLSVSELGRRLGIDKSSAHRMLATLEAHNVVRIDAPSRRYALGMHLVGLGAAALRGAELTAVSRPVLQALAAETGEAVHLAVLSQGEVLFVGKADAPTGALTVNTGIGGRAPAHCTALGKTLLAWLDDPQSLEDILTRRELKRYTARTIVDAGDLQRHLEHVRLRGYAVDDEERDIGLRCIAAPVRDASGRAVAALGVSGPAVRIGLGHLDTLGTRVLTAATQVSLALGYLPQSHDGAASSQVAAAHHS